jgi:hypothetical protein
MLSLKLEHYHFVYYIICSTFISFLTSSQLNLLFNLSHVSHLCTKIFDSFRYKNRHFTGLGAKTVMSV